MGGAVFNGDGTRILTWSWNDTARLWDAATGKEVMAPLRHQGPVSGAAFNGDESRILTWSYDGTARLVGYIPPAARKPHRHRVRDAARHATYVIRAERALWHRHHRADLRPRHARAGVD